MNTNELKYFIQLAQVKSISKAAEQMYISYQGLFKAIKNLEKELGYPLFYKKKGNFELTEYGLEFYRTANNVLNEINILNSNLKQIERRNNKEYHIGFSLGVDLIIPDFTNKFSEFLNTNKNIIMVNAWDSYCEEKVASLELDLALTYGPIDEDIFEKHVIKKGYLAAIIHESNPLCVKDRLSVIDLLNQRIITVNRYFRNYDLLKSACLSKGFEPNIVLNTINIADTLDNYQDKSVIGISNTITFNENNKVKNYKIIPIIDSEFEFELNCIINKKMANNVDIIQLRKNIFDLILDN